MLTLALQFEQIYRIFLDAIAMTSLTEINDNRLIDQNPPSQTLELAVRIDIVIHGCS